MGKKRTVLVEDAPDGGFFEVGFKAGDVGVVVDILSNGAGVYVGDVRRRWLYAQCDLCRGASGARRDRSRYAVCVVELK